MKNCALMMFRTGKLYAIFALLTFALVVHAGRASAAPIYIDDASAQFTSTGTWTAIASDPAAYPVSGSLKESGTGLVTATWSMPASLPPGNYEVWANWRTKSTYSTCVQFSVICPAGTTTKLVNQSTPATSLYFGANNRSTDNFLGIFTLNSSSKVTLSLAATTNSLACADAIMLVPTTETPPVPIDISDVPLATQIKSAPPNLMFLLDDSGSMNWEVLTTESDGTFSSKYYVFDNPGGTTYTNQGDNIYSNSNILGGQGGTTNSDRAKIKAQWSGYNHLYYNPKTNYVPWPTFGNASTTTPRSHPNSATPTFNLGSTYYTYTSDTIILDNMDGAAYTTSGFINESQATNEYLGSSYFSNGPAGDWAQWTTSQTLSGNYNVYVWWATYGTRDNAASYQVFDGTTLKGTVVKNQNLTPGQWVLLGPYTFAGGNVGKVRLTRSGNGDSTDADAVKFVKSPSATVTTVNILNAHYYTWDDVNSNGVLDAGESLYLVNLTNPVTYYRVNNADGDYQLETGELTAVAAANVPATVLTTVSPTDANAYTTERQNFANWYSYYRRRQLTAVAAISRAISNITNMQVGIKTINDKINQPVVPVHIGASDSTATLLTALYTLNVTAQSTPLLGGLIHVGQYYSQDDGQTGGIGSSPIATAVNGGECQQNFCIMMTDGYYNDSTNAVGNADGNQGAPYSDTYSNTLADVAMYYYKTDLAVNLADKVKQVSAYDNATWQHLNTYAVSFGVSGTLNPNAYPASNNFKNTAGNYPVWPNPTAGSAQEIDDLWHASVNGRGSFINAGDPQAMVDALASMVQNIAAQTGSEASLTLNSEGLSGDLQVSSRLYQTSFSPADWSGDITSYSLDVTTGAPILPAVWSARQLLQTFLNNSPTAYNNRVIATYDGSQGILFRYANLTASQQALLHGDSTVVDYLRGDSSKEVQKGGTFRNRTWRLGDIVNSMAVFNNDVLYVGANDGMMHAFDANTGNELFAYVPGQLYPTLYNLTQTTYTHNFFVNASPAIKQVGSATYLIGGLGKGGKGYYCLDISPANIATFTNTSSSVATKETQLKSMVKWEYSGACPTLDNDLGYTYSDAYMLKSNAATVNSGQTVAGYVVFFGNGYGSSNGSAVLYCLDPLTGKVIRKIDTQSGPGNGLSIPVLIDATGDFRVDYAYAGDLKGNLWKFDLSSPDPANWGVAYKISGVPEPLFRTQSPGQPITSKPAVMYAPKNEITGVANPGFMVIFGTGKYLGQSDASDTSQQTVYGIWDYGYNSSQYLGRFVPTALQTLTNLPAGYTLLQQTDIYQAENVIADFSAIPPTTTTAATVSFVDNSFGTITSRLWDFGDTTTSTASSPTHTYTSPGVYTVSLTATRTTPTPLVSSQKQATITVTYDMTGSIATDLNDNPTFDGSTVLAYFTGTVTSSTTSGVTVQFNNLSQGALTAPTYAWDFGDGGTSTAASPSHTYTTAGNYTVTLAVNSGEGADTRTDSQYITILHPWLVDINQNQGAGATQNIRVLSNNVPHYCTKVDGVGHLIPGPCPDDPSTVSINENDTSVYPVDLGWYFNLPDLGERDDVDADIINGQAWIISHVPQATMCSAAGSSWVMALDAASGGRSDAATFDANGDKKINAQDLVYVSGVGWVATTGIKFDQRVFMPGRLHDKGTNTDLNYYAVGQAAQGTNEGTPPVRVQHDPHGVVLWQEIN